MSVERPDVFVDPLWADEKDIPHLGGMAEEWGEGKSSRITLALGDESPLASKRATTLLSDRWVFACRMPAGTPHFPKAADLAAGRLVVPLLSPPLIEQAERYFSQHRISGVRFLGDHPGDLPRIMDDYPDAALFVPETLVSPRLGLLNVAVVVPEKPLTTKIIARAAEPDAVTALFVRHLRRALTETKPSRAERPVVSLRQIRYFNLVQRLRRVSAAARGANISQPALSEQIHKLAVRAAWRRHDTDRQGRAVRSDREADRSPVPATFHR
jgi:DNA-binding transcriptional LysR family regulator